MTFYEVLQNRLLTKPLFKVVWICYIRVEKQSLHDKTVCNSWEVNCRKFWFILLPQLSRSILFFQHYKPNVVNPSHWLHSTTGLLKWRSNMQFFSSFCKTELQHRAFEKKPTSSSPKVFTHKCRLNITCPLWESLVKQLFHWKSLKIEF